MINISNIGKRIRVLRKQKHLSQERMAEELGMYQADISNLERGINGSGISDIFKLDQIARYFGVELGTLLNDSADETIVATPQSNNTEERSMNEFTIVNARFGYTETVFASEIKVVSPDKQELYFSFSELDDAPRFYKQDCSIFDSLLLNRGKPAQEKKLNKTCFLYGQDYFELFEKMKPEWIDVCRYLIFIATEDEETANGLIHDTTGKMFLDFQTPLPSREPEDLYDVNYSDLSTVYRFRLMVEANLKNPCVYEEMDDTVNREKAILKKLRAACTSEEAYKVWKKDLVDAKAKEVEEKQKIVVCTYIFAGMGQYDEIMPEEEVDSFICWLSHCGSGFYGGNRPATKKEIRTYVEQHIADSFLVIDSSIK